MEVVYQRCAGVDVHQRFLVVCLSMVEGGQRRKEIRSFRNETADLLALRAWLVQEGCSAVGMESTGVYWMPVYRRLAACRRERSKGHISRSDCAHVLHNMGRSDSTEPSHRQNMVGDAVLFGLEGCRAPVLCAG